MMTKETSHGGAMPDAGCARAPGVAKTGSGAMTRSQILLYCSSCIVLVVIGISLLMRIASVSPQFMKRAQTPQTMGRFAPIPMGGLYGTVSVRELVNYYLENPPPAGRPGSARPLPKVGGC
ncbi:MAG: hypothetical protein ACYCTF_13560 [Acidiferrobacter sp.]